MVCEGETRTVDDIFDALESDKRRELLVALVEHRAESISPSVVTDAGPEADIVDRLVRMNHVHLPKLVAYGFVDWDPETYEVSKGRNFDEIRPLVELLADHEDAPPRNRV